MINRLLAATFIFLFLLSSNVSASPKMAPDLVLPGLNGEFHLDALKGKVVYLDFWASWCKPCKKSFPWMSEIKEKYVKQGFEIVAISLDAERKNADKFLSTMAINFDVAFDSEGTSGDQYGLQGLPSSYLIGRDGRIYASHIGFREKDKEKLEAAIVKLLSVN